MIGKYNRSVILTYFGVCLSLLGIFFAVSDRIQYSFVCLIFAGICDLIDGPVARICKRDESEKEFGVQIDTLADAVSFLAFPATLAVVIMDYLGAVAVLYTLAGIIRLAWFNMHADSRGYTIYYEGLPVTYAALVLPVYEALVKHFPAIFPVYGFAFLYILLAFLFVLRIKIAKPRGLWYVIFAILAVFVSIALLI